MNKYHSICLILSLLTNIGVVYVSPTFANDTTVREAQELLTAKGYDPGSIDGVFGKSTREAIKQFQKDQRLEVNGQLNLETREELGMFIPFQKSTEQSNKRTKEKRGMVLRRAGQEFFVPAGCTIMAENGIAGYRCR